MCHLRTSRFRTPGYKSIRGCESAVRDGGGRHSSARHGIPTCTDTFAPIRRALESVASEHRLVPRFIAAASSSTGLSDAQWWPSSASVASRQCIKVALAQLGFPCSLAIAPGQPFLLDLQAALLKLAGDPASWLPAKLAQGGESCIIQKLSMPNKS